MLASRGVHPLQIQSLGRWKSPLVLHYAGDAMSAGIAGTMQQNSATRSDSASQAVHAQFLAAIESRLAGLEAASELRSLSVSAPSPQPPAATAPDLILRNSESGTYHRSVSGAGKSYCGWAFGRRGKYSIVPDLPVGTAYNGICAYCLPDEREIARLEQLSGELSEVE